MKPERFGHNAGMIPPPKGARFVWTLPAVPLLIARTVLRRINVRDYGAKGEGATDETDAIQRAFDAVHGRSQPSPEDGFSVHYAEISPAVFPAGKYQISDTLEIRNTGRFRREGSAIHQKNPDGADRVEQQALLRGGLENRACFPLPVIADRSGDHR